MLLPWVVLGQESGVTCDAGGWSEGDGWSGVCCWANAARGRASTNREARKVLIVSLLSTAIAAPCANLPDPPDREPGSLRPATVELLRRRNSPRCGERSPETPSEVSRQSKTFAARRRFGAHLAAHSEPSKADTARLRRLRTRLPRSADPKPSTRIPGTSAATSQSISAFTTKRNKPKVTTVSGSVNPTMTAQMNALTSPRTRAPMNAEPQPSIFTPLTML